jgi:choline dehydrogenase-like flavoprotein
MKDGLDFKMTAVRFQNMVGFISLVRDTTSGRVYADPEKGGIRINYSPNEKDRKHGVEGALAIAKICYVTGAREIRACIPGLEPFIRDDTTPAVKDDGGPNGESNDRAFVAWLEKCRANGNEPPVASWASAHVMGTCKMSSNEDDGVVDPEGKVWGSENLFVADASVFPSASGVNPMVTNMAIADWIATVAGRELRSS